MKAVQINQYGGTEVLEVNENVPAPSPNENQVQIEVSAASINPFDITVRNGYLKDTKPLVFPATLGGDFAGIVTKIGQNVSQIKVGDEIYGTALIISGGSGSFAEFAAAEIGHVAKKPLKIDFQEAAALPLTGASAVQAIEEHMNLQKGQKILIHGGAGGIGTLSIQLAKSIGAYVASTASTNDIEYVKQLGADEVIDYTKEKFEQKLKDFDAVFDTVGGDTTDRSFQVLKKGGVLVSMKGQPNPELAEKYNVKAIGQGTKTNTDHLSRLAQLIDSRKIKPHIDKVFLLDQIQDAFKYQEEVHPKGKVVLKIKQS